MSEVAATPTAPVGRRHITPFRRGSVTFSESVHRHMTVNSPLKVRDSIPELLALPPVALQRNRERHYVNDGIRTDKFYNSPYTRPKRTSMILPYNAMNDRHSAGYFRSPVVQEVVTRTFSAEPLAQCYQLPAEKRGLHRMSARRRSLKTPPPNVLKQKEEKFCLDNVRSERLRNKQSPIVPEYDAMYDRHSKRYFKRRLVQNLLRKTVTSPQRLYPTINFYAPTKNDIVV